MTGTWTPRQVIEVMQVAVAEGGREALTWNRWQADGRVPKVGVIVKRFGSWRAAVEAAGFDAPGPGVYERPPAVGDRPCVNPVCGKPRGRYSRAGRCSRCAYWWERYGEEAPAGTATEAWRAAAAAQVIPALRALAATYGRTPTHAEWRRHAKARGLPSRPDAWFEGGWRGVVLAAGLRPRGTGQRVADDTALTPGRSPAA